MDTLSPRCDLQVDCGRRQELGGYGGSEGDQIGSIGPVLCIRDDFTNFFVGWGLYCCQRCV